MKLFPELTLSSTEVNIIAENLSHPAVQKYLQYQVYSASAGIVMGEPEAGEAPESYLRRVAVIQGMIKFAEQLLSIEKADSAQQSIL